MRNNLASYSGHSVFVGVLSARFARYAASILRYFDGLFFGFYGISTFVGHLTPNPFLCK